MLAQSLIGFCSTMIVFLGAESTQVWACEQGRRIEPEEGAVPAGAAGGA